MRLALTIVLLCVACGYQPRLLDPDGTQPGDSAATARDAARDAGGAGWSIPTRLVLGDGSGGGGDDPSFTEDGLELYFNRGTVIMTASRSSRTAPWGVPAVVTGITAMKFSPQISSDGLSLWGITEFAHDILLSTRATRTSPWSAPAVVAEVSSSSNDGGAAVSADGLTMAFESSRRGNNDLFLASRASPSEPWNAPVLIAELATPASESQPALSADQLVIYFQAGGVSDDIWVATRATTSEPFGTPSKVPFASSPESEQDPWLSGDGRHLVWASHIGGPMDFWESHYTP